ncbi:MAG: translation initiation factor 1 [Pseudohongiellaceae bacterium]|jgi:translation initiation factor 1
MSKPPPDRGELIFSPEQGAVPRADQGGGKKKKAKGKGQKGGEPAPLPDDGIVRVSRERRRGKGVTLITGVPLDAAALKILGKALKQRCGSGGTTKDGVIEVQGDHRDVVLAELAAKGYPVKRVGG